MTYIVSYDLQKVGADYSGLYSALQEWNASRIQSSVWALQTDLSLASLYDDLLSRLNAEKDRLLIIPFVITQPYKNYNAANKLTNLSG